MNASSRYRLITAGAILIVVLNSWVAWRALSTLFRSQQWQAHTLQVLTQTEATVLHYRMADSALRGFLLTGNELYDQRFRSSVQAVTQDVEQVRSLTADNSSQQQRIAFLKSRLAVKFGAADAALSMRRGRPEPSMDPEVQQAALTDSPDGGATVPYCLQQMENEERRLLDQRTSETAHARQRVIISFFAASLLDIVLLVLAFEFLLRSRRDQEILASNTAEIHKLNAELHSLNSDLEARVEQRTRELAVSNQELEAFSYSVSHDLRAPLRTIDGFSLALKEDFSDCLNEEGQDYINRVRGGVQRMGTLIDSLLQLSRVTRSEVVRERLDLSQMAQLVFDELKAADPGRSVVFRVQPGVLAQADPRLMRIALENLIGNALKYTTRTENPVIEFGCTQKDGRTVYFIRDNGVGFDMQYVDRLFTAFQRLHGDREFKGSGIGLATVGRIIRRHLGTIWAEGEVGKGATFYFTLEA